MALVVLPTLTSYIAETFPLLHLTLVALEAVAFPALTSVTPFLACQICMEELYIHGGWDAVACDALECAAALLPADAKIPTWKLYKESLPTTPPSLLFAAKKIFCPLWFHCYLKSLGFPIFTFLQERTPQQRSGSLIFAANEFRRFIGSRLDF